MRRKGKTPNIFPWKRWDIIAATIGLNVMGLAIPILALQLYDRIIPHQSYSTLLVMTFGIVLIIVMESVLRYCRSHLLSWIGMFFDYSTSLGAFNHVMRAKYEHVVKEGAGKSVENLEGISMLKEFMAGQGFLALLDLPFVLLYIGIIGYLSKEIVIVPIIILLIFIAASLWSGSHLRVALEKRFDVDDRRYNFIIQILSNYHTMKAIGMEDLILRRYERLQRQCALVEQDVNFHSSHSRDLSTFFSFLMYCGIICFTGFEVIHGNASMGVMAAVIILANRAMQPVQNALMMWSRFQHFGISKQRMNNIFSMPSQNVRKSPIIDRIKGAIRFEGVDFAYPDSHKVLFKGLSVNIEAGEIVSIFGPNGAGKTTLSQLLLGMIAPDQGEILIDDRPLSDYDASALHKQIGYLPPKGPLFQGSILDNMTLYQTGDIVEEAYRLSKELGLDPWIQKLPQAYQTKVGDSLFYVLPDGIQQRICLVRALLQRPAILVLDEANTSLDDQGDLLLKELLLGIKNHSTVIFITHRPSIQSIADTSYELKDGQLIQTKSTTHPGFLSAPPPHTVDDITTQEVQP